MRHFTGSSVVTLVRYTSAQPAVPSSQVFSKAADNYIILLYTKLPKMVG
jgi:hypothetical protein